MASLDRSRLVRNEFISCYWAISNNFGDLIGPYILEKMSKHKVVYAQPVDTYSYYVFGGSIINHVNKHAVVWGAGLGTLTDGINPEAKIHAVRGPLTRARALSIGINCPSVYGDPGMLLPKFYTPPQGKKHRVGVLPHYVDAFRGFDRYPWVHVIDVFQPIEAVIDAIASCDAILSSSLHGIVVAHAYGVPAAWVKISDSLGGDGTKFRDYFNSVGMDYPHPIDLRENLALPDLPKEVPSIPDYAAVVERFWKACPLPANSRKPQYCND